MIDAAVSYSFVENVKTPVFAKVPMGFVTACPSCVKPHLNRDYYPNNRNTLTLANPAFTRMHNACEGFIENAP